MTAAATVLAVLLADAIVPGVVPVDVPFPTERVIGADDLHVALTDILRHCGHRAGLPREARSAPATGT